ncbi:hypothetical protein LJR130_005508 [Variovorax sp. LjRoot130]
MLALVGAGEPIQIEAGQRAIAAVPATAPAPWWREAGTVCEAVMAFGEGRHGHCAQQLLPLLPVAHGFGGSQAQRSLIYLTAMEAARRAGDAALWEALQSEAAARTAAAVPERPYRGIELKAA